MQGRDGAMFWWLEPSSSHKQIAPLIHVQEIEFMVKFEYNFAISLFDTTVILEKVK